MIVHVREVRAVERGRIELLFGRMAAAQVVRWQTLIADGLTMRTLAVGAARERIEDQALYGWGLSAAAIRRISGASDSGRPEAEGRRPFTGARRPAK
jgi:hypothetical protein